MEELSDEDLFLFSSLSEEEEEESVDVVALKKKVKKINKLKHGGAELGNITVTLTSWWFITVTVGGLTETEAM